MYGTVARIRMKPGTAQQMQQVNQQYQSLNIPGFVGTFVYQMDSDPNECYMAVVFDTKDTYWANARDPQQDARYRQMRALLESDPEWHDGEIIFSEVSGMPMSGTSAQPGHGANP
ncbi:MAG: hypothetical protein OJF49_004457 [Ktedonobacterales bacterium]|jgi:heme-degrading monooxygenase HmoA|nr:MAG: hypothetical protein OJF49_004457 [Ktedonobacterales bacterium]